ncbi:MAG: M28 family peptidase [Acidobacteriota bacterium]|nr:MAG: M28 family peptidase [Acidobacteriota bacterium]
MKIIQRLIIWTLFTLTLAAQPVPFLGSEEYDWISNEISGDAAFEHIRVLTQYHRPGGGSEGLMEAARYVEKKAREYGLEDVQLIRQSYSRRPWNAKLGEIWLIEPELRLLASTNQVQIHLADYSRTTHLESAEIVDVGRGTESSDYETQDVKGKIVLAYGSNSEVMREAVWLRGALGILNYPDPGIPDYPANALSRPEQIHWSRIPAEDREDEVSTFAFQLSSRQAVGLKKLLTEGEAVRAKVDIEAVFGKKADAWQVMVEGYLKGTEIDDQDIVLTGHLQEEKFSANDDASGCASLLEIARSMTRLVREGRIAAPRRNIRFWWVTEISSQRQYFADNPEASARMLVNINQDMVGANQAQDVMRVQNITRVPFSLFHFLNDVAEAIVEFVQEGNRSNLSVLQAGIEDFYPRPILSRLGSRHRYNAALVPFHNNSDHMPFNEAPIGVPAISFTNWPDNFIHTSDDDLWNIDQTQLQRNAFIVAAIAYVIARAGDDTFPELASQVAGRCSGRLGEDYRLALDGIREPGSDYWVARDQLEQAYLRELRALQSLETLSQSQRSSRIREGLEQALSEQYKVMESALARHWETVSGSEVPERTLNEFEAKLDEIVPKISAGPTAFLGRRGEIGSVSGLHSVMASEVLSFIDGQRTGFEIFRAVRAEARRAGSHYYGEVEAEAVFKYLENARNVAVIEF